MKGGKRSRGMRKWREEQSAQKGGGEVKDKREEMEKKDDEVEEEEKEGNPPRTHLLPLLPDGTLKTHLLIPKRLS